MTVEQSPIFSAIICKKPAHLKMRKKSSSMLGVSVGEAVTQKDTIKRFKKKKKKAFFFK